MSKEGKEFTREELVEREDLITQAKAYSEALGGYYLSNPEEIGHPVLKEIACSVCVPAQIEEEEKLQKNRDAFLAQVHSKYRETLGQGQAE